MRPVIIVHGGAKTISGDKVEANQVGCAAAVESGWEVLRRGGSAADAVEAAIRVLESDQTFNAGFGSTMNSEGEVDVDAAIMDGATLAWGAAVIGCGLYADNRLGACSTTGDGESIIPVVLAKTSIDALVGGNHPDAAVQQAIATLAERVEGEAGCILLDTQGRIGWAYNSSHMAMAYMNGELSSPAAFICKNQSLAIA